MMAQAGEVQVRGALRDQILRGELIAGQRLVEFDLAEQFGVTRGSVRSALIGLSGEGLVERIPHRGARVRVVTIEEAIEITECRMVLEGLCAAKAASRATANEAEELTALVAEMRDVAGAGDLLAYSGLNHLLHRRIREISGQQIAVATIERLRGQIVRHQFQLALRPGRVSASLPEHEKIVTAIVAADAPAAERAMKAHLGSVILALKATVEGSAGTC